jgi:hypothetical protein
VLAHDEALGTTGYYTITAILAHDDPIIVYVTIDGEQIETTPEHPFYTGERGWVTAGELRVGDHIRNAKGDYGVVQATTIVRRVQRMYNLTVAEAHTFFVGSGAWLVHNDCGDGWFNPADPTSKGAHGQAQFEYRQHGQKFKNVGAYTRAAQNHWLDANLSPEAELIPQTDSAGNLAIKAVLNGNAGLYTPDGGIIWYAPRAR